MKDAWPFPLPEITFLIFCAQILPKAGGERCPMPSAVAMAGLLVATCGYRHTQIVGIPVQRPGSTSRLDSPRLLGYSRDT
jgi:hypothetical protein